MLDLCFDVNTYSILKMLQAEKYIDSTNQMMYLYDDLSIGSLNVKNIKERILSLKELEVEYDYPYMINNYKELLFQLTSNHSIRIWTSSYAHEKIGFYMVCYIICKLKLNNVCVYVCDSSKIYQNEYATMFLDIPNDYLTLIDKKIIIEPDKHISIAKKS